MTLVQVARREGRVDRVPRDQAPVIELDLNIEAGEYVAGMVLKETAASLFSDRATVDWVWSVFVVTPL